MGCGNVVCIPGQPVCIVTDLCGGVWMMLNRRDVLLMLATGLMVVVATECLIWAITGCGILLR